VTDGDRLRLRASVKLGEGLKRTLYKDSLGYWTIGYGRLLDPEKGGMISQDEAEYLLANDLKRCEQFCETIAPYLDLSPPRQAVLVEMCFNLGPAGLRGFKNMLAALKAQAYPEAAAQMLQSKWRTQVGDRAVRLATQLETGVWS
jgi:lysozyme